MRLYCFTNYYLSSLQQGLQSMHVLAQMTKKASVVDSEYYHQFIQWANNYQIIVLLNGGNNADLRKIAEFFMKVENPFLYAAFCEDDQSLGGTMTSVGILVPDTVWEAAAAIRTRQLYKSDSVGGYWFSTEGLTTEKVKKLQALCNWLISASVWHMELIELLNSRPLAK